MCKDITISLDTNGAASINTADIDCGSGDNCGTVTLSLSQTDFNSSDIGDNSVTLTVTDSAGNTAECVTTVTVEGPPGIPEITCPADLNLTYNGPDAQDLAIQNWINSATALDAFGASESITTDFSATSFSECEDFGTQTVTFTSASGETCTSVVTVSFVAPSCVTEDFESLNVGDIVSNQLPGVTVFGASNSNSGNMAMIFDSANPTGGDTDLASSTAGLILIISEDGDSSDPDDDASGGTFTFDFDTPQYIEDIGFLDIENPNGTVRLFDANSNLIQTLSIPTTGDGGAANLIINTEDISSMEVELMTSGAVTDFCTHDQDLIPTCVDIGCLTTPTCDTEGFEAFTAGTIIGTQIPGITVTGSANSFPGTNAAMIFDSANPTGGDYDLATNNEGMILILTEDGDASDPDDDAAGGTLVFDFATPQFIDNVTLLDIQSNNATIEFFSSTGALISQVSVPNGGNGNLIYISTGVDGVSSMEVYFPNSGAVVDFCTYDSGALVPCPAEVCDVQVLFSDFEGSSNGGYGVWTDGGNDSNHSAWNSPRAVDTYAVRLRDNSNSSKITSQQYDLSTYSNLTLDFSYYAQGTEVGDDFFFEVSTDGGSSFSIIETWVRGTDFNNESREFENITFAGPFSNQTVFRFRNDMTNNGDRVFIDNILIDGCTTNTVAPLVASTPESNTIDVELTEAEEEVLASGGTLPITLTNAKDLEIYPNPVSETLNIIGLDATLKYEILNLNGAVINTGTTDGNIGLQNLQSGAYILRTSDGRIARFIKI